MPDPRNALKAKFEEPNRFANFGNAITQIVISGFRCHTNTVLDVRSPITALCGLNGTGKSTILQLVSTAVKAANTGRTYYMRDFFLCGRLDPAPFSAGAAVVFQFWQPNRTTSSVKISRSSSGRGWSGYRRRPSRSVFFAGVGLYIPKIEQRGFVARDFQRLSVTASAAVEQRVQDWSCKILSQAYTQMTRNHVKHAGRDADILSVTRAGATYSEMHMGFGEGRSQYLVGALEHMPNKSLVLIEEPETSLHPAAQFAFGEYLIDVAIEKGHQVFLSTHSESLLQALPDESRMYLHRMPTEIKPIAGLSAGQAQSLMTGGYDKALCVLVEDDIAQAILGEIVRSIDPQFLDAIEIVAGGDKDSVARTVRGLKDTGLKVAAVRDGDKEGAHAENIFKLPGTRAPEIEMFESPAVILFVQDHFGVALADFRAGIGTPDHHEWFGALARNCTIAKQALVTDCARAYTASLAEADRATLVNLLKEAAR